MGRSDSETAFAEAEQGDTKESNPLSCILRPAAKIQSPFPRSGKNFPLSCIWLSLSEYECCIIQT